MPFLNIATSPLSFKAVSLEKFSSFLDLPCLVTVSASEHSVVLKEVTVPLWQNAACERALRRQFGSRYSLPETSICAGAEGRDACDVC
jgi:hypothetical protein